MTTSRGFTLIELMIVVAIVAIVAAILPGALSSVPVVRRGVLCSSPEGVVFRKDGAWLDAGIVWYDYGQYIIPPGATCEMYTIEEPKP